MTPRAGGPSYLPANRRETLFWLALVFAGAFLGRVFVIHAYRLAHR